MTHLPADSKLCANCDAPMDGAYCSHCGQRETQRLTFMRLAKRAFDVITDLDWAFARTTRRMLRRPEEVCLGYITGRRREFSNPVLYLFYLATAFIALATLLQWPLVAGTLSNEPESMRLLNFVATLTVYLIFVALLPTAIIQRWLFESAELNLAEHYVILLFIFGFNNWFAIISGFLDMRFGEQLFALAGLSSFLFYLYAGYRIFPGHAVVKTFKLFLVFVAETIFFQGMAVVTAEGIVTLGINY